MLEKILEFIFPNVCGICGKINKNSLCPKCNIKLKEITKAEIRKISNKNFAYHAYMFEYKGMIRDKIIDYKFNDKAYLYRTFAEIIIKNKKICRFIKKYDIITSVPIHKKRKKERGYNQSGLLCSYLARELEIQEVKNSLEKTKYNVAQMNLNKADRINNVKNVYMVKNAEKINNKKVLLIDDIYTTGSTVNECSKVLKQAGALEVAVLTIAKD
ncbi:MAG: ComF family protein [Clostridia bacterium]|nr:ComF family protein [Clostridia bacterium]